MELIVDHISKSYSGKKKALDDVCFRMTPGIYGLLGPNGAGKTTLLNILTENLKADEGTALYGETVLGKGKRTYRQVLGYAPQQQWMYDDFRTAEYLHYMASLKGIPHRVQKDRVNELLEEMNLQDVGYKKIKALSGGMKQRLLIAQALLNDPEVLLLDEPTAGLDPRERIRIRNLISEKSRNRIVILATHVVPDVECIARKILLLKQGKMIGMKAPADFIRELYGNVYTYITDENGVRQLQKEALVSNVNLTSDGFEVRIVGESPVPERMRTMVTPTLEDVYLYWMEGNE